MKALLISMLPFLVLLASDDEVIQGESAYEEGRFEEALEGFMAAETTAGHGASAELLINKALAALQAGKLIEAEVAAEKAAARGGPRFFALRDFLLGNAAFARCKKTEAKAGMPEAEPFLFDLAIKHAEQARDFWQQAATSRTEWSEARRNVERSLLKLRELKKNKAAKEQDIRKKKDRPEPQPEIPPPDLASQGEEIEQEALAEPQLRELPPELVGSLFDKLDAKEKEKIALRQAQQQKRRADVEKDW
jgi:hypothetical protein